MYARGMGAEYIYQPPPPPTHHLPQSDRSLCPVAEKAPEMQPHAAGSDVEDHSSGVLQRLCETL